MARRTFEIEIVGDASQLSRSFTKASVDTKLFESRLDKLNTTLGNVNTQTRFVQNAISTLKMPALIAGAGTAAQAVGALGAAAVAAGAALAPLAGAIAAYPALGSAAAQAMGVFKLATSNVFEAVGGLNQQLDKNTKAFKALSPEAQKLAVRLDAMKKPVQELSSLAQRGLFPGLIGGIDSARRNLPVLQGIVKSTAEAMGNLARRAGELIGSKGFGRDLQTQGARNVRWMTQLGVAGLKLFDALRHVTLAAGPLTSWMVKLVSSAAKSVDVFAKQARSSGELASFFGKTRAVMAQLVSIGGSLATAFFNIGRAAVPLGREILAAITANAKAFADWTGSVRGNNAIRQFFADARAPIFEMGRLVRDLVKAFFSLSAGGGPFTEMVRTIRVELLPVFTRVVQSTTNAFGPPLIEALKQVALLFGSMAGSSGPLVVFVQVIGKAAQILNALIGVTPGLQSLVVTAGGLAAVTKALNLTAAASGIKAMAGAAVAATGAFKALAAGETFAAVAAERGRAAAIAGRVAQLAMAGAAKVGAAAQIALNVALRANPIGIVITAVAALGAALVVAYKRSETFRNVVNGAWAGVKEAARVAVQFIIARVDDMLAVWQKIFETASHLPLVGDKFKGVADKIAGARGRLDELRQSLDRTPTRKKVDVDVKFHWDQNLPKLQTQPPGNLRGDGVGKVIGAGARAFAQPAANRVAATASFGVPAVGGFPSSLDGANAALSPFAAIGGRFGLHVSAGRDHHSTLTKSGNVSFHSTGEAIDLADGRGPDAQKMGAFNFLASNYGSRLAELIYTPAGYSIKNGQRVSPIAAADHYDHVHVALDLGRPGPGIGDGTGKRRRFTGDGLGISQLQALAQRAGFSNPGLAAAVAMAESGGNTSAVSPTNDYGLWQINRQYHPQYFQTPGAIFNPLYNARAALAISGGGRNWQPWTTFRTGAYRQYLSAGGAGSRPGPADSPRHARDPRTSASPVVHGSIGAVGVAFDPTGSMNINAPGRPTRVGLPDAFGSAGNLQSSMAATNLAIVEAGPNVARANAARQRQRAAIVERITALRQALRKRRLSRGKRIQYQNELADLIGAARQIDADVADSTPAPAGPDTTPADTPAPLTEFDFSDLRIAEAEASGDQGALLSAEQDRKQKIEAALGVARASGDVRGQIDLLGELKGVSDSIKGLQDTIDQEAEARRQEEELRKQLLQANTDAMNAVRDELKRSNDIANATGTTELYQIKKWMTENVAIGLGRATQSRGRTPGSGVAVAY